MFREVCQYRVKGVVSSQLQILLCSKLMYSCFTIVKKFVIVNMF